ncbi:MAG: PAS domain-containing protein [Rhodoferax sp.]|nr:PAS domain-containing protein [Rhodoferax sp.]
MEHMFEHGPATTLPSQELHRDPLILKVPMSILNSRQDGQQQLRVEAEKRLKGGNPPPTRGPRMGMHSLALLHSLASSPAIAGNALELLHELQVHQVELDLQHEQADEDRHRLVEALQSSTRLFDAAPFGSPTLDPDGKVVAANHIAAAWLGVESEQWTGRSLEDLVPSEDRITIHEMLRSLRNGGGRQKCLLRSKIQSDAVKAVATAATAATGAPVLLAFMPVD